MSEREINWRQKDEEEAFSRMRERQSEIARDVLKAIAPITEGFSGELSGLRAVEMPHHCRLPRKRRRYRKQPWVCPDCGTTWRLVFWTNYAWDGWEWELPAERPPGAVPVVTETPQKGARAHEH